MRLRHHFLLATIGMAFAAWLFATPYLAVQGMRAAIASGDAASFNDYVDFPALKENIKGTMNAKLVAGSTMDKGRGRYQEIGAALAAAMIAQLVDAFITPESVAMMMKGDRPKPVTGPKGSQPAEEPFETSMKYETVNRFVLTATKKGNHSQPIGLVFRRDGFYSWKLSAIRLPE